MLLEEWHRLIPDNELVELPNELAAGGIVGLDSLPLRWKVWRGNRARSRVQTVDPRAALVEVLAVCLLERVNLRPHLRLGDLAQSQLPIFR